MNAPVNPRLNRRGLLKLIGGGAVLIPLGGISACSKKEAAQSPQPAAAPAEPASATAPASAVAPAADAAPATTAAQVTTAAPVSSAASGELPHLEESDPTAQALGYRQDSSQVDAVKYPKRAAGQACKHCVQFNGSATAAWGGCNIFAGKQVKANGWCSAFAARA